MKRIYRVFELACNEVESRDGMMVGIFWTILCLGLTEFLHIPIKRALRKRGLPFEWQHLPLFAQQLVVILALQQFFFFPLGISLIMKFIAIYSATGLILLLLIGFIRRLHYQSYIFFVNWLKKGEI